MTNSNLPEKYPNFVLFKTADGKVNIDVYFHNETLWLSQSSLPTVSETPKRHIKSLEKNL
jgi:hypothetical protein